MRIASTSFKNVKALMTDLPDGVECVAYEFDGVVLRSERHLDLNVLQAKTQLPLKIKLHPRTFEQALEAVIMKYPDFDWSRASSISWPKLRDAYDSIAH